MISKIVAKALAASTLLALAASASAAPIDIFTTPGIPGTGGDTLVPGPCYCEQSAYFSPIMSFEAGTYNFGKVRDYWVESGSTPDGGPDQPNLWLLFAPEVVTGSYPDAFSGLPTYAYPASFELCNQDDAACNAKYQGAFEDFSLDVTLAPGQDAVQIGLIGDYLYSLASVPEPSMSFLLAMGLPLLVAAARRGRSPA